MKGSGKRNADLDDEIAAHLKMAIADRIARGEEPKAAAAAARREFGNITTVREVTQRMWRGARLRQLLDEFRIACRTLRRTPRFAVASTICIALGVGATTTIFSALQSILLAPLPYPNAESVVAINAANVRTGSSGASITPEELTAWRDARTLAAMATWRTNNNDLIGTEAMPERVNGAQVDANLFQILGVHPQLGRMFTPDEQTEGANRVVILGADLWKERFGQDTTIVGRTIRIGASSFQVIGIMPVGFDFPDGARVWTPLVPPRIPPNILFYSGVIATLRPGVKAVAAHAEIGRLTGELDAADGAYAQWTISVRTLRDDLVGGLRTTVYVFQGASLLVLLIACANVAALMLARGTVRERELTVRAALGADRSQLAGHIFVECAAIACAGGIGGTVLAFTAVPALAFAFPDGVPAYLDISVRTPALLVSLAITAIAGFAFGAVPAFRAAAAQAGAVLHGARGSTGARRRTLDAIVTAQIAMSVVLLASAVLLIRTYVNLRESVGFRDEGVASLRIPLPSDKYRSDRERDAFYGVLRERLRAIPGVTEVTGTAHYVPFDGPGNGLHEVRTASDAFRNQKRFTTVEFVDGQYLQTLGVQLRRGRYPTVDDIRGERTAVVNETFARNFFPAAEAVNERVFLDDDRRRDTAGVRIVGVVADFRTQRPPADIPPAIYEVHQGGGVSQTLVLRTREVSFASLAPAIRVAVHELDPALVTDRLQTETQVLDRVFWRERMHAKVLGLFALLAVLLALSGIYGVLSYAVAQRTAEFGIRIAVGASTQRLILLIVGQGARIAVIGTAIGVATMLGLGGVLSSLIYGVGPRSFLVLGAVSVFVLLVAAIASVLPAVRAAKLNPVTALGLG